MFLQANVIPSAAQATVNFRIHPSQTAEEVCTLYSMVAPFKSSAWFSIRQLCHWDLCLPAILVLSHTLIFPSFFQRYLMHQVLGYNTRFLIREILDTNGERRYVTANIHCACCVFGTALFPITLPHQVITILSFNW